MKLVLGRIVWAIQSRHGDPPDWQAMPELVATRMTDVVFETKANVLRERTLVLNGKQPHDLKGKTRAKVSFFTDGGQPMEPDLCFATKEAADQAAKELMAIEQRLGELKDEFRGRRRRIGEMRPLGNGTVLRVPPAPKSYFEQVDAVKKTLAEWRRGRGRR